MAESAGIHHAVKVYGTDWCEDTTLTRVFLGTVDVPFNYYNVELDAGIERTFRALQNGGEKSPVVDLGSDIVLIEPTNDELAAALKAAGHLR
jgi:mycoredoxin